MLKQTEKYSAEPILRFGLLIGFRARPKSELRLAGSNMALLQRWVLLPERTQRQQRQVTEEDPRNLVEMVDPGGIASGDLGLLFFSAVLQDLVNDLPGPGERGLDMGVI